MKLATSRYHAGAAIASARDEGLIPIGITVGAAKWLPYELAGNLGPLAPWGLRKIQDPDEFERLYLERLEQFGVPLIAKMLEGLVSAYRAEGAVLLCFENVHELGERSCHRRTFARWWEEKTGEQVPELG